MRLPVVHVLDEIELCFCEGDFLGRGGLWAAAAEEERHSDLWILFLVGDVKEMELPGVFLCEALVILAGKLELLFGFAARLAGCDHAFPLWE